MKKNCIFNKNEKLYLYFSSKSKINYFYLPYKKNVFK